MNENIEKFLDYYKELEIIGRKNYFPELPENESIIGKLIRHEALQNLSEDLNYCRLVRNFITHNPKVDNNYLIEPSNEMLKLIKNLIKLIDNPPLAIDSAISKENMFFINKRENIIDVMQKMNEYAYTHVPILENDIVVGVFSDHAICSYMRDQQFFSIKKDTTIGDLEKYILLDDRKNEYFYFVSENTKLYYVENLFYKSYKNHKILAVVFITENGKKSGKLKGMITPWELLSDDN